MKANIENIYKKMTSEELALIAFKSISTQDEKLLDTIEANVKHGTFVGRDFRYHYALDNRVNFAVWFGLQYHCVSAQTFAHRWQFEKEETTEGKRVLNTDIINNLLKIRILLGMANRLCDAHRVDKKTFLGLSQISLKPDDLAAVIESEDKHLDDELTKYKHDMEGLFVAVLTRE